MPQNGTAQIIRHHIVEKCKASFHPNSFSRKPLQHAPSLGPYLPSWSMGGMCREMLQARNMASPNMINTPNKSRDGIEGFPMWFPGIEFLIRSDLIVADSGPRYCYLWSQIGILMMLPHHPQRVTASPPPTHFATDRDLGQPWLIPIFGSHMLLVQQPPFPRSFFRQFFPAPLKPCITSFQILLIGSFKVINTLAVDIRISEENDTSW